MPDSLIFDNNDDRIIFEGLPANLGVGALTIMFIVKRRLGFSGNYDSFLNWNAQDGGMMLNSQDPQQLVGGYFGATTASGTFLYNETTWIMLGYGKVAGLVVPRFHKYSWATGTHSHGGSVGGDSLQNFEALTSALIGDSVPFPGQHPDSNILIAGIWNSLLSDATVETLVTGKQAWIDAAPAVAWRFDTMAAISALVGTSTQTSRVGTTLDVGDAPAGWVDGPAGPPPQTIHPDADVTTTGWTAAPLWSKVDEEVADDGDFITSTAS
jgi:hypothetical protein